MIKKLNPAITADAGMVTNQATTVIARNRIQPMAASFKAYYLGRQLIKEKRGIVNIILRLGPVGDHGGFRRRDQHPL